MTGRVPHWPIVVGFCIAAITGYAGFSAYAVLVIADPALIGDIIGTWKSFAVLAFGFWLGSSSGGKAKDGEPLSVNVANPPSDPVPIHETGTDLPRPTFGKDE